MFGEQLPFRGTGDGSASASASASACATTSALPPTVLVVGGGKAVVPMAAALVDVLLADAADGDGNTSPVVSGHIVTKHGHCPPDLVDGDGCLRACPAVTVGEAAHPVPDAASVTQSQRVLDLVEGADPDALVFVLLTGGGSSLLTLPAEPLTLADVQLTTDALLKCGATINELNAVRKHVSAIAGGRLAVAGAHARLVTLALSDVVGDPLDVIASGPTVGDPSSLADCRRVLDKYALHDKLPRAVVSQLVPAPPPAAGAGAGAAVEANSAAGAPSAPTPAETPFPGDPAVTGAPVHLIASNQLALRAAASCAVELGYAVTVLTSRMQGEAKDVAAVVAAVAVDAQRCAGQPFAAVPSLPAVILMGGETTVTLPADAGKGGRNQELALASALHLDGVDGVTVLACGTDGTDGPTDATGAVVDGGTVRRGAAAGHDAADALRRHDAYHFFQAVDELVVTGPTGTNVMDLVVAVVEAPGPPSP